MDGIFIDFAGANKEANAIEELAAHMKNTVVEGFGTNMEEVAGSWKGENATAFLNKGERMQERLYETVGDIEKVADCIRSTARALHEAEERAKEIAATISGRR